MRALAAAILLACGGCSGWGSPDSDSNRDTPAPSPSPTTSTSEVFETGDKLLSVLKDRVSSKVGLAQDDFQVIVTDFGYPVGTILPEGRSVGINKDACKPAKEPDSYEAPNLFPAYSVAGKVAFEFGLDSAAIQQLAKFGVKGGAGDTVRLSISGPAARFLLDDELRSTVNQQTCQDFLRGGSYLLVRGYISGKRNYQLERDRSIGGDIGVTQIASFKIDGSSASSVGVSDEAPAQFLQIVSKVSVPAQATAAPVAAVTQPTVPEGPGQIFVQRDVADNSGNADKIVSTLAGKSLKVVPTVERIASGRVPTKAIVKYFNVEDAAFAESVVQDLRAAYPNAESRFVGLSAPKRQLEIWLPRADAATAPPANMRATVPLKIGPDLTRVRPDLTRVQRAKP